jgi:hypothetical protein
LGIEAVEIDELYSCSKALELNCSSYRQVAKAEETKAATWHSRVILPIWRLIAIVRPHLQEVIHREIEGGIWRYTKQRWPQTLVGPEEALTSDNGCHG